MKEAQEGFLPRLAALVQVGVASLSLTEGASFTNRPAQGC